MADETHIQYAPAWVPEPNGRGTWGILYSCTFTLSICVWSAIHLNVPRKGERDSLQGWRKTMWVFIAIFAPEAALYSAWQQWYLARRFCIQVQNLCRDHYSVTRIDPRLLTERWMDDIIVFITRQMKKVFGTGNNIQEIEERSRTFKNLSKMSIFGYVSDWKELSNEVKRDTISFSIVYGFYVVMGGLVVNTEDIYDHERARWHVITTGGVVQLAKRMTYPNFVRHFKVDTQEIEDKSKADNLTKLLVIFQVLWAALNSISRVALGYAITVLEVHTLVHAACATMMYILWFKKPLDIRDPTTVSLEGFTDELALMLVRSPGSAYRPEVDFVLPRKWKLREIWSNGQRRTFPDPWHASEATFLCLDESKYEVGDWKEEEVGNSYSIVPRLPDVPSEEADDKGEADDEAGMDGEEGAGDESEAGNEEEAIENKKEPDTSEHAESNPEAESFLSDGFQDGPNLELNTDRSAEQGEIEASLGTTAQKRTETTDEHGVCRKPPEIRLKPPKGEGRIQRLRHRFKPPTQAVPIASTLTTGEFLKCGLGPSSLLTYRGLSVMQQDYNNWMEFANWVGIEWFKRLIKSFKPVSARLVEIDERLRPFIDVPGPHWIWDKDKKKHVLPAKKDVYYHEITAELSSKDVVRWTRACSAFRAELRRAEKLTTSAKEKTTSLSEEASKSTKSADSLSNRSQTEPNDEITSDQPANVSEEAASEFEPKLKTLWKAQESEKSADDAMYTRSEFVARSENIDFHALHELWDKDPGRFFSMWTGMTYVSCVYAGIHLGLWNHDFPTRAESILWKISGITLGIWAPIFVFVYAVWWIIGLAWVFTLLLNKLRENTTCKSCRTWLKEKWHAISPSVHSAFHPIKTATKALDAKIQAAWKRFVARYDASRERLKTRKGGVFFLICMTFQVVWVVALVVVMGAVAIPLATATIAVVPLYVFSRVYIVVESFLSLRRVPVGVYRDVSWAQYIPHL